MDVGVGRLELIGPAFAFLLEEVQVIELLVAKRSGLGQITARTA